MNRITLAQREALDVVKDMIDKSNPDVPEFGTKVMTLILGILNVDCRVDQVAPSITADPDKLDNTLPIDYEGLREGNDRLNMADWLKELPTPPFSPHTPFPPQVWYNQEPVPIQTDTAENVRYAAEVSCTGDKNGIVYTTNTADVQYNGDFRDVQTSFNDK